MSKTNFLRIPQASPLAALRWLATLVVCVAAGWPALEAQTLLDLGTQSKNIDFTQATFTRPFRLGSALPSTCTVGDVFFLTGTTAGRNSHLCSATNVWTPLGADIATQAEAELGGIDTKLMTPLKVAQAIAAQCAIPGQIGNDGAILSTDGSTAFWTRQMAIVPATATVTAAGNSITASRFYVQVAPTSSLTLTSTPTIPNGTDGQFLVLTNTSTTNTLTLQDEAVLPGSNLRLGGSNLALAPRQSAHLAFNASLNDWVRINLGSSSASSGSAWERQFNAARCQNTVAGAGFSLPSTNAPTATCQTGTNTTAWATLDWDDTGTKTAFDFLMLPNPLPSTVRVDIAGSTGTTATAAVNFRIATACVSGNPDPAFNTAQTISFSPSSTAGNIVTATLNTLTLTGCSAGQQLRFRIDRDTTDASTATARLHWVKFYGN